jgi:exopolyphosphatase/guanosine-5'-triphosphate,3'-diphosphate pyrophosphatase
VIAQALYRERSDRRSGARTVGFFDVGTNAARMLCATIGADGSSRVIAADREQVRLGEGEFVGHALRPDAVARTIAACERFVTRARSLGADELVGVATAAVREAANAAAFLDDLEAACGLRLRVLSGRDEAELLHRAVRRRLDAGSETILTIDIGGGSTEVVLGSADGLVECASLPLGALRLTATAFPDGFAGPVDDARYALLRAEARQLSRGIAAAVKRQGPARASGTGGTVRSLARVAATVMPQQRRRSASLLWRPELTEVIDMLRAVTLDERRRLPGLEAERADTIVAGAAILDALMEGCGIDGLDVPDVWLLRDGLLADYAEALREGRAGVG